MKERFALDLILKRKGTFLLILPLFPVIPNKSDQNFSREETCSTGSRILLTLIVLGGKAMRRKI